MPGLTRFPKPEPDKQEQILEAIKRLEEKIDALVKGKENVESKPKMTVKKIDDGIDYQHGIEYCTFAINDK